MPGPSAATTESTSEFINRVRGDSREPPASLESAKDEHRLLVFHVQEIEAQLGSDQDIDPGWRRRAIDARRHYLGRMRFLRSWIDEQAKAGGGGAAAQKRQRHVGLPGVPTTELAREAARRIGYLESVYIAAVAFVEQDTDETWLAFEERVRVARSFFEGNPVIEAQE